MVKMDETFNLNSTNEFKDIFILSPDLIGYGNLDGYFTKVNPAFERLLGYPTHLFYENQFLSFIHPDDVEKTRMALYDAQKGKNDINIENRYNCKDGSYRWIAWHVKVNIEKYDFIAIGRDITERKITEEKLSESENQLRLFANYVGAVLLIQNMSDGGIEYVNPAYEDIFDQPIEELLKDTANFLNTVHPEDRKHMLELLQREVAAGKSATGYQTEYRIIRSDGKVRWIDSTGFPIRSGNDKKALYGVIARDVTKQKETDRIIQSSLKEKEILLKEIHHRVKNNLAVIISLLNLQAHQFQSDYILAAFQDSCSRLKTMALVHETLYESENMAEITLSGYLKKLGHHLEQTMTDNTRPVRITYDIENIVLEIDQAIPCGLILNELLTNAFKYAFPEGDGVIRISGRCYPNSKQIELIIQDNGVGLPEEMNIDNIESLGIKIVSLLVKSQLEGSLDIRNDNGTRFEIRWPFQP